jgi:hypothetical protein
MDWVDRLDQFAAFRAAKRLVPRSIKQRWRAAIRRRTFNKLIAGVKRLPRGVVPSRETLIQLSKSWGNEGYSADVGFLQQALTRLADSTGPILECGSGLSTILIGIAADATGRDVCALEHHRDWYERVRRALLDLGVRSVRVILAPLKSHGDFDWYDVVKDDLPRKISLVVVDGPPEVTRGGRYGVVPIVGDRLAPTATLIVDDANTSVGRTVLEQWRARFGARIETIQDHEGELAVVRLDELRP